jgi:hypothetical protein
MTNIYQELKAGADVLELIDRKRAESDNPALGSAIERVILDHCLAELERDAGNSPACDAAAVAELSLVRIAAPRKLRKPW